MKNKNGFTLIEVLAIIVIISVLALILVPVVLDKVENAEKKSFKISVQIIKNNTEKYLLENKLKELPNCQYSIVKVKDINLKNKNFSDESYICYDDNYKCNYINVTSQKNDYTATGCYDDVKISYIKS